MKLFKRHGRRIGVLLLDSLLGKIWFFRLIGLLNRRPWLRVKSIFLLYPANEKYALEYTYRWFAKKIKWRPTFAGFFIQNGNLGLTFGISATEKDFRDFGNRDNLISLHQRMEQIKRLIGADQKTFAGVLPSLFVARGVIKENDSMERKTTIKAILQALERTKEIERLAGETPVIILGGSGFIGTELRKTDGHHNFYSFDLGEKEYFRNLVEKLSGQSIIVLNLTKKGALSQYIPYFQPGVVMINEVYPEPSKSEVRAIKERGASCYHITGVKAKAWPAFPRGYEGGIPCCASFLPDKEEAGAFEVIMRKMQVNEKRKGGE